MDERYLLFKATADCGGFSKAARQLHLSQPAISMQVRALEDLYGAKLFDRARQTTLTEAGRILYRYVEQCLELHETARKAINEATGVVSGSLRLGATLTIGEYILPKLVGLFLKENPEVAYTMEIANTEVVEGKLVANELDLGLIEGPVDHPQLSVERFLRDELVVVLPASHRWATRKTVTVEELLSERLILRETGSGTRMVLEDRLEERGLRGKVKVAAEFGSTQAIKEAVLAGLGIAVISACTVRRETETGLLRMARVRDLDLGRDLNIFYNKHRFRTRAAEVFLEFLRSNDVERVLDLPTLETAK